MYPETTGPWLSWERLTEESCLDKLIHTDSSQDLGHPRPWTSSSLDIHSLWGMLATTVVAIKYMFVLFFILVPVFIVEFVKIK